MKSKATGTGLHAALEAAESALAIIDAANEKSTGESAQHYLVEIQNAIIVTIADLHEAVEMIVLDDARCDCCTGNAKYHRDSCVLLGVGIRRKETEERARGLAS